MIRLKEFKENGFVIELDEGEDPDKLVCAVLDFPRVNDKGEIDEEDNDEGICIGKIDFDNDNR